VQCSNQHLCFHSNSSLKWKRFITFGSSEFFGFFSAVC
jgi:hypothetical protein